jgi:hypothetical protein
LRYQGTGTNRTGLILVLAVIVVAIVIAAIMLVP